jgi:hypothetical protein
LERPNKSKMGMRFSTESVRNLWKILATKLALMHRFVGRKRLALN